MWSANRRMLAITRPKISPAQVMLSRYTHTHSLPFQINNPDLFRDKSLIGGEWKEAKSGKRFDVYDPGSNKVWATAPDNTVEDTDAAVKASYEAFQSFRKVNPRQRAQWLLKWDQLIRDNRDDLANIVTYETGKPLAESQGELDYALGFTWWFAGEAERVMGTVQMPAAPNRRVFTIKQPIGVAVALVPWNCEVFCFEPSGGRC